MLIEKNVPIKSELKGGSTAKFQFPVLNFPPSSSSLIQLRAGASAWHRHVSYQSTCSLKLFYNDFLLE